jgi:hypothetical protein
MTDPQHADDLALLSAGQETGFWDERGHPAPWPNDIDEWRPVSGKQITVRPGQQPF